jgi:hypothetical protein
LLPELPEYVGLDALRDLTSLALQKGYTVLDVKGDGNCLFRAVSKSLKNNAPYVSHTHEQLRAMVVKYLKNNKDFLNMYLPYVSENDATASSYIEKMSRPGTWGDLICLKTLSVVLKIQFKILILNIGGFQLVSQEDTYITVIPLGFVNDQHYTGLKRLSANTTAPTPNRVTPSIVPEPVVSSRQPPSSLQPLDDGGSFKKVKPLSSVTELLEIMEKVKPYLFDDISQLQKADSQIMVSLGVM